MSHFSDLKNVKLDTKFYENSHYFYNVFGDERRYQQILINFLSNAIKFSIAGQSIIVELVVKELQVKQGGEDASIINSLSDRPEQQELYISFDMIVQDFGCGMAPESVKKIFVDFNKMDEHANLNTNGVGLGLSICKNLIEQMAGSVHVESEMKKGTRFIISFRTTCKITENFLPVQRIELDPSKQNKAGAFESDESFTDSDDDNGSCLDELSDDSDMLPINQLLGERERKKPIILIANDNILCLDQLKRTLKTYFVVVTAENGLKALEAVQEKARTFFDAIVLDVQMPIMDGFEAGEKIGNYLKGQNLAGIVSVRGTPLALANKKNSAFDDDDEDSKMKSEREPAELSELIPPMYLFTSHLSKAIEERIPASYFRKGFDTMKKPQIT